MTEIAKTDYKLGQDNVRVLGLDIHNPVFVVSSLTIIAFVAGVLAFPAEATAALGALHAWLIPTFDWVFMGAGNFYVLFCLLLVATPLGRVRLGGANARPDYSRLSWFAMLFAAGMGIGLMFFGVSEPVEHFLQPPLGREAAGAAAARLGMAGAIYHWGIHGWAIYAVAALSIAFASYNLGLPMTLRSAFYPLMGEAVWGRFGHGIDILAVLATLFGLATSLGLWRPTNDSGARPPMGHADDRRYSGPADRRHHRHGADVGCQGDGEGGQAAERSQPAARPAAAGVRADGRPDARHHYRW